MSVRMNKPSIKEPSSLDKGLRSLRGIRWLLAAGALVSAVSVYRLVESQWDVMSVAAQFLTLVVGALVAFGSGDILRNRLRLPQAGSALLYLFTALVPVLAWGAAYLRLLADPLGWLTFVAGMGVLLTAATRVLRQILRYQGVLYPVAFGFLALSLPLLPQAKAALSFSEDAFYALAATVLGMVFYAGSCHINRFLFHRDHRDGIDRPVHFLPFLALAILFVVAMGLLDVHSTFIALPLAIVGIVLVTTGEEYYRALARSLRTKPASWPKRSVALLSVGFSLVVIAWPLSWLDPNLRCIVFVSAAASWLFLAWGLRYKSVLSHVTGVVAALVAYHLSPNVVPELARSLGVAFVRMTGIAAKSPVVMSFAHLGFLIGLFSLGLYIRRERMAEAMEAVHAILTLVHGSALVAIALVDFHSATVFLPCALGITFFGMLVTRRVEILALNHGVLAAGVLAGSAVITGASSLITHETLRPLGLFTFALALLSPFIEHRLAPTLRTSPETTRQVLLIPAAVSAFLIGLYSLSQPGWTEIAIAGAIFLVAGHRLADSLFVTAGIGAASIGVHGWMMDIYGHPSTVFTLVTHTFFVGSWVLARLAVGKGRDALKAWSAGTQISMFVHGLTAALWLLLSTSRDTVTVETLVLPLVGLALLDWGLLRRYSAWVSIGMGLSVIYVPFHLWTTGWIDTLPMAWVIAAPILLAMVSVSRWSESEIARHYNLRSSRPAGAAAGRHWTRSVQGNPAELGASVRLRQGFGGSAEALMQRSVERRREERPRIKDSLDHVVHQPVKRVLAAWVGTAFFLCLVFSGVASFCLALTLLAVGWVRRTEDGSEIPAWAFYLALVQLVFVVEGAREGILLADFAGRGITVFPAVAVVTSAWLMFIRHAGLAREMPSVLGVVMAWLEGLVMYGYLYAFTHSASFSDLENTALITLAIASAVLHGYRCWHEPTSRGAWLMQAWTGLAVVHGFAAGWLSLETGIAPYALLAAGTIEYGLTGLFRRRTRGRALAGPAHLMSQILPLFAGALATTRVFADGNDTTLWLRVLPLFLTSLFYLIAASREPARTLPALAASGFLGLGLTAVAWAHGMGSEFYCLAPGASLLALSYLLREEMGPTWCRHTFAAGAAFIYATPVLALYDELSWTWQAVLLVLTVVFGAASFVLRSRSLLTVSTAAMLIDLACFVIKIRETEPLLLWVGGLGFGIALIAYAAYLEYQREGLAQRIRVLGQELQAWH